MGDLSEEEKVILLLSEFVRKLREGSDYLETSLQTAEEICQIFKNDEAKPA